VGEGKERKGELSEFASSKKFPSYDTVKKSCCYTLSPGPHWKTSVP